MDDRWNIDSYKGKILFKHVHYDFSMDMDYYTALVWNGEDNKPWTVSCGKDTQPDATPEVWQKYFEFLYKDKTKRLIDEAEFNAVKVEKGKKLRVIKGRKYEHGLIGLCFWAGTSTYGYWKTYRAGMTLDDTGETIWINQSNVEVVDPKPVDSEEMRQKALEDTRKYAERLHKVFSTVS